MIESTTTVVASTIINPAESVIIFPVLSLLLLVLPIACAIILIVSDPLKARMSALIASSITLLISLFVVFNFDQNNPGFQFIEQFPWISSLNIDYIVGVDGLSILFLPLTSILFIGIILSSWTSIRSMPKLFYILLLILETATL